MKYILNILPIEESVKCDFAAWSLLECFKEKIEVCIREEYFEVLNAKA